MTFFSPLPAATDYCLQVRKLIGAAVLVVPEASSGMTCELKDGSSRKSHQDVPGVEKGPRSRFILDISAASVSLISTAKSSNPSSHLNSSTNHQNEVLCLHSHRLGPSGSCVRFPSSPWIQISCMSCSDIRPHFRPCISPFPHR